MSNAILPNTLAVCAVGSALVYCYDLQPIYDTNKNTIRTGGMERHEVWPPVSHVVMNIPCSEIPGINYGTPAYTYALFSRFYCCLRWGHVKNNTS